MSWITTLNTDNTFSVFSTMMEGYIKQNISFQEVVTIHNNFIKGIANTYKRYVWGYKSINQDLLDYKETEFVKNCMFEMNLCDKLDNYGTSEINFEEIFKKHLKET